MRATRVRQSEETGPVPPPTCRPLITSAGCRPADCAAEVRSAPTQQLSASGERPDPRSTAVSRQLCAAVALRDRRQLSCEFTVFVSAQLPPSDCGLPRPGSMAPTADSDDQPTSDYLKVNCRNPYLRKFQAHRLLFGKHQIWCVLRSAIRFTSCQTDYCSLLLAIFFSGYG